MELCEGPRDPIEDSDEVVRRAASAVSLDRMAQQYARVTTGIGTDQLWAALRHYAAATLLIVGPSLKRAANCYGTTRLADHRELDWGLCSQARTI